MSAEWVVVNLSALPEPLLNMLGREPAGIVQTGVVLAVLREHGTPAREQSFLQGTVRRIVTDWLEDPA